MSQEPQEYKTPITREQWRLLKPGDGIKDCYGRVWIVEARDSLGNPDRLYARCPDNATSDRLDWIRGQILEEEHAIMLELNHPSVTIVIK